MMVSKFNDPDSVGSLCLWTAESMSSSRPALGKMSKNYEFRIEFDNFQAQQSLCNLSGKRGKVD